MPLRKKKKKPKRDELPPPPSVFGSSASQDKFSPPPGLRSSSSLVPNKFDSPPLPESPHSGHPPSSETTKSIHSKPPISGAPPPLSPATPSSPRTVSRRSPLPEPPQPTTPLSPPFAQKNLTRPPLPEPPQPAPPITQSEEESSYYIQQNMGGDILNELREKGFGSTLRNIETQPTPRKSSDDLLSKHYLDAKESYIAASKKHLELNFYESAASNYACAVLSEFLGRGAVEASHLMSELATGLPSSVISSPLFQGARVLLKAVLIKNPAFFRQAKKWLTQNQDHLYQEDKVLIKKALENAEVIIEM